MGRYKAVTHQKRKLCSPESLNSVQSWSHYEGVMAILKYWNDKLSRNGRTCIVKHTRRQLIKSSLMRNIALPDCIANGETFGEHGLELDFDRIVVRTVKLHYQVRTLQENCQLDQRAEEVNSEARDVDVALQDWITQIADTNFCTSHILSVSDAVLWGKLGCLPPITYSYINTERVAVWLEYYATRMLINSVRLKALVFDKGNRPNHPPTVNLTRRAQQLECLTTIKTMASNLASSIPFCLGRFAMYDVDSSLIADDPSRIFTTNEDFIPYLTNWVVWPLNVASSIERLDDEQRLWFRSELANIGAVVGNGVLECAESNHWVRL